VGRGGENQSYGSLSDDVAKCANWINNNVGMILIWSQEFCENN